MLQSGKRALGGKPIVTKHWRQDWQYQPASVLTFIGGNAWEMRPVSAAEVPRVAQLTQKTNQFNLTTRRYSEAQIAGMLDDGARVSGQPSMADDAADGAFAPNQRRLDAFAVGQHDAK